MPESDNFGVFNTQQKNPNPLLNNKFIFQIRKLMETSWSCKTATLPSTSVDIAWQTTRFNPIPRSGIGITYDPFQIEFIVDEDLNNYVELINWMRLMSMPVQADGYGILKLQDLAPGPEGGLVSDAVLSVLTNESNPNFQVFFRDCFPIYLSELRFSNAVDNPEEQVAVARFAYTYFDLMSANPEA